ncbi:hypothetical protein [Bifidobacterium sp.]|jgi:hypothetical protein|uniref:hypothetical protein n=1 Tax=Bifidobacterium sp. TaxID=41200 RepID=UPI0025C70849|nr:hypothetical protein [Bifidobacterium sp.]MCI1634684.1 hypothetical protein [Bifidobacterium sp.]
MQKIQSGQSFLYRSNGYNSTVLETRMTEHVRGDCIDVALSKTARRFPDMAQKLVERDGSYYLHANPLSLHAANTDRFRTLGGLETGYHLIDVTYTDKLIRVAFHHCLCDGRGIKPFMETLMYYYCCERYGKNFDDAGILTLNTEIDPREYQEPLPSSPYDIDPEAIKAVDTDGYALPESTPNPEHCYRTSLSVDQDAFVALAKHFGATPGILAAELFSQAVVNLHPDTDKAVICNMAADMRFAVGGLPTRRNCTASLYLPYSTKEQGLGIAEVSSQYRSLIREQRSEDSAKKAINMQVSLFKKLDSMDTLDSKRSMMGMFDHLLLNTYVLSYVGQMQYNDFAKYVESVHMYSGGIKGLTLNMIAAGKTITFDILQGFEGDQYALSFAKELRDLGLECSLSNTSICETGADHSHITAVQQPEHWHTTA